MDASASASAVCDRRMMMHAPIWSFQSRTFNPSHRHAPPLNIHWEGVCGIRSMHSGERPQPLPAPARSGLREQALHLARELGPEKEGLLAAAVARLEDDSIQDDDLLGLVWALHQVVSIGAGNAALARGGLVIALAPAAAASSAGASAAAASTATASAAATVVAAAGVRVAGEGEHGASVPPYSFDGEGGFPLSPAGRLGIIHVQKAVLLLAALGALVRAEVQSRSCLIVLSHWGQGCGPLSAHPCLPPIHFQGTGRAVTSSYRAVVEMVLGGKLDDIESAARLAVEKFVTLRYSDATQMPRSSGDTADNRDVLLISIIGQIHI